MGWFNVLDNNDNYNSVISTNRERHKSISFNIGMSKNNDYFKNTKYLTYFVNNKEKLNSAYEKELELLVLSEYEERFNIPQLQFIALVNTITKNIFPSKKNLIRNNFLKMEDYVTVFKVFKIGDLYKTYTKNNFKIKNDEKYDLTQLSSTYSNEVLILKEDDRNSVILFADKNFKNFDSSPLFDNIKSDNYLNGFYPLNPLVVEITQSVISSFCMMYFKHLDKISFSDFIENPEKIIKYEESYPYDKRR